MENNFDDFEEIISDEDKILIENSDDDSDDYEEVLQLTQYDGNLNSDNNLAIVAEYNNIDIVTAEKKHTAFAKSFVQKIAKFIIDFKDVELTDEHNKYIKQVGQLQLENLADLLTLVEINKGMINNIVLRVNSVQAEDYAMISTYTTLVNQHIKLLKELHNSYKNIPNILKKMKTEVFCNQELLDGPNSDDVITENYGTTQFNNQKEMLKKLKEEYTNK